MSIIFRNRVTYRLYRVIKSKFLELKYFLTTLKYFLMHFRNYEPGWYNINRKFIVKADIEVNNHFYNTILRLRPFIKLYNLFGSKDCVTDFVHGMHPDMDIKIYPQKELIKRIFKQPVLNNDYQKRRDLIQQFIPGPSFSINTNYEYEERLLIGESFTLSKNNNHQFIILLNQFKNLAISESKINNIIDSKNIKPIFKAYSDIISKKIQIDLNFLQNLLSTSHFVVSKGSDLAGPNIIMSKNNLILIDWEPRELKSRAYWSDLVNLILNTDPTGFFSYKYRLIFLELIKAVDNLNLNINDKNFINTLAAANSFWNLPNLHFLDFDHLTSEEFEIIINSIEISDLMTAVSSTEILCNKYAN